jgi:DNA-directed RNA polymerase sigma subunit (sigma70/sigma32)
MWKSKQALYENIIRYKNEHPESTLEEIGEIFGLTRQRISQILLEYRDNGTKDS